MSKDTKKQILKNPYNLAKDIWKEEFGNLRGFDAAWKAANPNKVVPAEIPEDGERAHALVHLGPDRWVVRTYIVSKGTAYIINETDGEPKQFSAAKLREIFLNEVLDN